MAPPQELIKERQSREVDIAKAKLNLLNGQYQQKQKDYQDLRAETLRVIQGASRLNVDLLNSIVEETTTQMKELEQQIKTAEANLQELVSGAEKVRQGYDELMNWAKLFDNCNFEAKKALAESRRELDKSKQRVAEIDCVIQKSYEDLSKGLLTEERFAPLTISLESEQRQLKADIPELEASLNATADKAGDLQKFIFL